MGLDIFWCGGQGADQNQRAHVAKDLTKEERLLLVLPGELDQCSRVILKHKPIGFFQDETRQRFLALVQLMLDVFIEGLGPLAGVTADYKAGVPRAV